MAIASGRTICYNEMRDSSVALEANVDAISKSSTISTNRALPLEARLPPGSLKGDKKYPITTREVPLEAVVELCFSGELLDASSIADLYLAREYPERGLT